jgi:hypothetical protein
MTQDATSGVVSNKTIDDIVQNAVSSSQMLAELQEYNLSQSLAGAQAPPPSETQQPSREPVRATAFRVVYPYGNIRCEIIGVDEKDLDAQEAAIRKIYAGRK